MLINGSFAETTCNSCMSSARRITHQVTATTLLQRIRSFALNQFNGKVRSAVVSTCIMSNAVM